MRHFLAFSLLVLVAATCFAEGNEDIGASVRAELVARMNFTGTPSIEYFQMNDTNYGFVSDNGTEKFIVVISQEGNASLVVEDTTIDSLLAARRRWLLSENVMGVLGDLVTFNQSRELEYRCKSMLGLDAGPCFNETSCLEDACVRSQGLCLPTALGNGAPFLKAMVSFSKATVAIDLDLGELAKGLNYFSGQKTMDLPSEARITDMIAQAGLISSNNLFKAYSDSSNGFEFCAPIPYRTDSLESGRSKLVSLRSRLGSDNESVSKRDYIISQTLTRMAALESARNKTRATLEEIKTNASAEFAETYQVVYGASQTITGEGISARIAYLNQTLSRIMRMDDLGGALAEYGAFANESKLTKTMVADYLSDFDSLVKLSNECSGVLSEAYNNVTSPEGKAALEGLMGRKGSLDSLMGPPLDEKYIGSIRGGLNGILSETASLVAMENAAQESAGPDPLLIGAAAAVVLVVGIGYWAVKNKKLNLSFLKKQKPKTKAGEKKSGEGEQAAAPNPQASKKGPSSGHSPASSVAAPTYRVKLNMRGGAYRTQIRTVVKDRGGKPVPDGTTVTFKCDTGIITPSAVTKGGMAYAGMAFKAKPAGVTVCVTALGIERSVRIAFI